ncbi:MAG: FIST signal transduction protein [Myxococcales bacterium]
MTTSAVVHTDIAHPAEAGTALASLVQARLGERPDVVILFASPRYDFPPLLAALDAGCRPKALVGCSSAGEFTSGAQGVGMACAIALRAPEMSFSVGVGRRLTVDRDAAARDMVGSFAGLREQHRKHRSALILADALAGHMDALVERLTVLTASRYRLFGGGAGGDDSFQRRFVFAGTEAIPDAAVALEILSDKPLGIGVRHGWTPASAPMRVTEAEGMRLGSLDAVAAAEVFEDHAQRTRQKFDRGDALPFFLHNVLGVEASRGHKLRVPLSVEADGSVACATEVPAGSTVQVMGVTAEAAARAAGESVRDAIGQLQGRKPEVALFFDCVATRLRMGKDFGFELQAVQEALGEARFAGCNSIGQIAGAEGQFSGFHNCTAVVCVIPE